MTSRRHAPEVLGWGHRRGNYMCPEALESRQLRDGVARSGASAGPRPTRRPQVGDGTRRDLRSTVTCRSSWVIEKGHDDAVAALGRTRDHRLATAADAHPAAPRG